MNIRFPIKLVAVACLLTTAVFAWFGWIVFDARRDVAILMDRLPRTEESRDQVAHWEEDQRVDFVVIMAALFAGGISLAAWWSTARGIRQWQAELLDSFQRRAEAEENLSKAHAELEERIDERTAELAKANEALRSSQQVQEGILNAISVRVFWKDTNLVYLGCNAIFARDAGFTDPKEIIGKDDRQLGWREQAELYREDDRRVIESGNSKLLIEESQTTPDGNIITLLTSKIPLRSSTGEISGVLGTYVDITERKRAEEELRASQANMASAQRIAHFGSWELDLTNPEDIDSNALQWSDEMFRIAGYEPGAFHPTNEVFFSLVPAEEHELIRKAIDAAIRERRPYSIVHSLIRPDGEVRVVQEMGQISLDERTCLPLKIVGTAQDITERTRLEAKLLQSQKMETVGKLAGGVAHEFNSILTAIIGQSEFLLEDLPAGSALHANATQILQSANRVATLTRQLLAYGRKQFLRPESLDLNRVIADMDGMLRHLLGGGVDIQIVPAHGLQSVQADAGQFEQVIVNIAMNAADAMPNGGKLTIETANVSFDEGTIGRYPELDPGEYVMMAITDTGIGMSEEVKARVFEPFYSTKGVGEGTGLGLSTGYGIIKQSGGHLSVYSEQGRGTTFKIYLPQVEVPATIPTPLPAPPDLPRGTETVLLVEDDPALREMAATLLTRLGYTVLAAADGIQALTLKQQPGTGHIDLLFTDVVMPHMSGKELAERVRALYPHTRILFTSAFTENAVVHQGVLAKGMTLLQKPFTPSALAHKLREVLDQPSPRG